MTSTYQPPLGADQSNLISPSEEKEQRRRDDPRVLLEFYDDDDEDGEVDGDKMAGGCEKPKVKVISNPINPTKNEVREHRAAFHIS